MRGMSLFGAGAVALASFGACLTLSPVAWLRSGVASRLSCVLGMIDMLQELSFFGRFGRREILFCVTHTQTWHFVTCRLV
jgi:hypothetical protein